MIHATLKAIYEDGSIGDPEFTAHSQTAAGIGGLIANLVLDYDRKGFTAIDITIEIREDE